jgi:hypothetical protein
MLVCVKNERERERSVYTFGNVHLDVRAFRLERAA